MSHHPLAGVIWKLRRSDEHLAALYNEYAAYANSNPQSILGHRDTGDGKPGYTIHFPKEPSIHLSVVIGDVVQNMRAALDYIAHELTIANNVKPTRKTMFPIGLTEDDFLNQAITIKKLNTVSLRALKVVSAIQPYRMDNIDKARLHPLHLLAKLSNMDKHHTLALSAVAVGFRVTFTHPDGRTFLSEFKPGVVHDGAVVATMPADFFDEKIETHIQGSNSITFRDAPFRDRDLFGTLQGIREFIGKVVLPAIEPFFDPLPDHLGFKRHGLPKEVFQRP